jgi:hypothetical protein
VRKAYYKAELREQMVHLDALRNITGCKTLNWLCDKISNPFPIFVRLTNGVSRFICN